MVTVDVKELSNEEVINLINEIKNQQVDYSINDLKNLLAQATNRRLGSEYIDIVNTLIHSKLTNDAKTEKPVRAKRSVREKKPAVAAEAEKAEKNRKGAEAQENDFEEQEKFPILSFLSGLYKAVAWLCFVISIMAGFGAGIFYFADEVLFAATSIFGGIAIGTIFILVFYALSESISLKLEIERHLRRERDK